MRIGVTYLFELEAMIDPDESLELPLFVVGLVVLVAVVAAAVAVVVGVAVVGVDAVVVMVVQV